MNARPAQDNPLLNGLKMIFQRMDAGILDNTGPILAPLGITMHSAQTTHQDFPELFETIWSLLIRDVTDLQKLCEIPGKELLPFFLELPLADSLEESLLRIPPVCQLYENFPPIVFARFCRNYKNGLIDNNKITFPLQFAFPGDSKKYHLKMILMYRQDYVDCNKGHTWVVVRPNVTREQWTKVDDSIVEEISESECLSSAFGGEEIISTGESTTSAAFVIYAREAILPECQVFNNIDFSELLTDYEDNQSTESGEIITKAAKIKELATLLSYLSLLHPTLVPRRIGAPPKLENIVSKY
jgi:hypothetical protein